MNNTVLLPPIVKLDGVEQKLNNGMTLASKSNYSELMFRPLPDIYYATYDLTINNDRYLFVVSEGSVLELFSKEYPTSLSTVPNTGIDHRIFITRSEITGTLFRHSCSVDHTDLVDCHLENSHVDNSFASKFSSDKKTVYNQIGLSNSSVTNSVIAGGGNFDVVSLSGVHIQIPPGDYSLSHCDLSNVLITGQTALLQLDVVDIGDSHINFVDSFIANEVSIVNASIYGTCIHLTDIYSMFVIATAYDDFIVYEDDQGGWEISGPGSYENSHIKMTTQEALFEFVKKSIGADIYDNGDTVILESITQLIWDSYVSRERLTKRIRGTHGKPESQTT